MKIMKIGIDVDDVLAILVPNLLKFYNSRTGFDLTYSDIKSYRIYECGPVKLTIEEFNKILLDYADKDGYKEDFALLPDAELFLGWLKRKHRLGIVTSRPISRIDPNKVKEQTIYWCLKKLGDIFEEFYFVKHDEKVNVYNAHFDLAIEDRLETALECKIPVLLLDHPWNQNNGNDPKHIIRIKSENGLYQHWDYLIKNWFKIEKELSL